MFSALQLFCLIGVVVSVPVQVPSCDEIAFMSQVIANTTIGQPSLIPLYVRLGFHDCVGGCNGCINFNTPNNNGLAPAVSNLTQAYYLHNFGDYGASLADFFALAATVGVRLAVQQSNDARNGDANCTDQSCPGPCPVPCFKLLWGREDETDCSTNEPEMPSAKMNSTEMFEYFKKIFGFNIRQVVALLGAHSLGGAHRTSSGYSGRWNSGRNPGLNELLYLNMINKTNIWTNVDVSTDPANPRWQFNGKLGDNVTNAGFMLNTDFELVYDLTLDPVTGRTTCILNTTCGYTKKCQGFCPRAKTFRQSQKYSEDCQLFMSDFVSVFQKMLKQTKSKLRENRQCYHCIPIPRHPRSFV